MLIAAEIESIVTMGEGCENDSNDVKMQVMKSHDIKVQDMKLAQKRRCLRLNGLSRFSIASL